MPPVLSIVGLILAGVGLLFQIIGVATNEWVKGNNSNSGLWEFCLGNLCADIPDASETGKYLSLFLSVFPFNLWGYFFTFMAVFLLHLFVFFFE